MAYEKARLHQFSSWSMPFSVPLGGRKKYEGKRAGQKEVKRQGEKRRVKGRGEDKERARERERGGGSESDRAMEVHEDRGEIRSLNSKRGREQ